MMPTKAETGQPFWQDKSLADLNQQEWEQLCDGCARCCLHKLEDEDTGIVYYTNIACRLLDQDSCSCKDYSRRNSLIRDCVVLDATAIDILQTMPPSCAYRRVYEGKPLPSWHYLISGDRELVHQFNHSVRGKTVNEADVIDYEDHIVDWPLEP